MSDSPKVKNPVNPMGHQCTATVGSAALDVVEDPALADEVGVTSGGRVANILGQSSPEDSCYNKPQDALVRNSSEEMTSETCHRRSTQLDKFQQEEQAARRKKYMMPMFKELAFLSNNDSVQDYTGV